MRNEKGEDWAKYLKEINRLTPMISRHMDGGSAVPLLNSRQAARAAGFKNQADADRAAAEAAQREEAIEKHKAYLINKWFADELSRRLPEWLVKFAGPRMWVLKCLGFKWGMWDHTHREGDMPKPMPATWVWLRWAWVHLAENRLLWDNPAPSKRKNIIQLP